MRSVTASIIILLQLGTVFTVNAQELLKLEDIWGNRQFVAAGLPEVRSMNDGLYFTELSDYPGGQCVVKNDFKSGKTVDTLFRSEVLKKSGKAADISDYQLSDDESMILISTETESIYRHSTRSTHYIYNIKSKSVTPVSMNGKQMYATFSPNGKYVAFVRDNNLYIKELSSGNERAVTTDGKKNEIINGATDWVYEEEFSFDRGYQWAPDGNHIAYYRFDESRVKEFNLTYYGTLYPKEEKYKYPKA